MQKTPIHITQWGQNGPRVLMVHGSAQGSSVGGDGHFATQRALGDQGWTILVPDRPGHGKTPAADHPDDAQLDGKWVADMLGDASAGGAHLVGHSFGGCVALAAAAMRPTAVRSLTLIEPGMQKLATDKSSVRQFGMKLLLVKYLSFTAAARATRFAKLVGIPPEIGRGKSQQELTRMGQGIARLRVPSRETLYAQLTTIRQAGIPLLVVTGGWCPAFEETADVVAATGGGRRLVIASPHHFPQQVSQEFNNELAKFMSAHDNERSHAAAERVD